MPQLIVANWKLNPMTVQEAVKLARAEDFRGVVIAPPFPFLEEVGRAVKRAKLGAQDAFWIPKGAYTGEVSAHQLRNLRVSHIIVGHSERRRPPAGGGETDEIINKKVCAALAAGLKVILCVGEPWSVRRRGLAAAKRYVAKQLRAALDDAKSSKLKANNLIIAYEPVWAIGTNRADQPADAVEMAKFIKTFLNAKTYNLKPKVLYGGSVTARNAAAFLAAPAIDGALVGGASLRPRELAVIIEGAI